MSMYFVFLNGRFVLPVQVTPFPWYPVKQAQVKDPLMLVQVAAEWQLSVLRTHSLISQGKNK